MLSIHDEEFKKIFNLSANDVIEGICKLQYSLSQAKAEAWNDMYQSWDDFRKLDDAEAADFLENKQGIEKIIEEICGTKLNDVIEITNWPEIFVKELSWGINSEKEFYSKQDFAGWPVIDLPIQKRPFIEIDGKYYCFDYYSFMDNFYRVIQKVISRLDSYYDWAKNQQEASETMVERVFCQIFPGCTSYRENFYPKGISLKQLNENDLLIEYHSNLFIIKVKAGSFVYTPPLTDFAAHIKSYKTLIEKADWQCDNTYKYLTSSQEPLIYDNQGLSKAQINMSKIKDIYMFSVTMDNINDFATRARKIGFLKLKSNAISISIDDLMVYRDYFTSPLKFLHFLKQRKQASFSEKIEFNDELDHLGMYIEDNCYTLKEKDIPKKAKILWVGYREQLDTYFTQKYYEKLSPDKPTHQIPELFSAIISLLENEINENAIAAATYLLDFSDEAKEGLNQGVIDILKVQEDTKIVKALNTFGTGKSLRYTVYVNQDHLPSLTFGEKRSYVLAQMIRSQENDRVMLDLFFDSQKNVTEVYYEKFTDKDINEEELDNLKLKGEDISNKFTSRYLAENPGKIGRNDLCPCCSGKKYKRCCGK